MELLSHNKRMSTSDDNTTEIFWLDDNCGPLSNLGKRLVLLEVPQHIATQLEHQAYVDDESSNESQTIEVLKLIKARGVSADIDQSVKNEHSLAAASQAPFTTSITPDELLMCELMRSSHSIALGFVAPTLHPFILSNSVDSHRSDLHSDVTQSREILSKVKGQSFVHCVYVGEKQSILTLRATYPRFDQLLRELRVDLLSSLLTVRALQGNLAQMFYCASLHW